MRFVSLGSVLCLSVAVAAAGCSASEDPLPDRSTTGGAGGGASLSTAGSAIGGGGGASIIVPAGGGGGDDNPCGTTIDVTFRDFTDEHPDFERADPGWGPAKGMVEQTLDDEGKPIFRSSTGDCQLTTSGDTSTCNDWVGPPMIENATTFAQWYRTIGGTNLEFHKQLELTETSPGSGQFEYASTEFFPLDGEGFGNTPSWATHNYLFTTEIHLLFGYIAGQKFTFDGDDDLWIFVNGKLALELGGLHSMFAGTIDFDAQAADLGISPGGTYRMDVFHAERHTYASDFKIQTNISCFTPVVIK